MTKDNNNIMIAPGKNHNAEAVYQIIGNAIIIKDIRQERIPIILYISSQNYTSNFHFKMTCVKQSF